MLTLKSINVIEFRVSDIAFKYLSSTDLNYFSEVTKVGVDLIIDLLLNIFHVFICERRVINNDDW